MLIYRTISEFQNAAARDAHGIALATGFFDGVHRGHQRILSRASHALTFTQHPTRLLAPANARKLLTPLDVRLELLAATGITGCLLLDFTPELAQQSPEQFIAGLGPNIRSFHCGENWRFGRNGAGTPALLAEVGRGVHARLRASAPDVLPTSVIGCPCRRGGAQAPFGLRALPSTFNFSVHIAPPALWRGEPVSSTRIRDAIRNGSLHDAERMLGRPYFIRETIVPGRAIGRTLNFPTLNIHPCAEILPPVGVYAVRARFAGEFTWRGAVANFGFRPTFPDRPPTPVLEVHLLAPPIRETTGLTADIAFIHRLRDERAFPTTEALATQLRADCAHADKILNS